MADKILSDMRVSALEYLARSRDLIQVSMDDPDFLNSVTAITEAIASSLAAKGKLLTCGNGGSAGDAQHIAGEFISRLNYDRAPAASIALTTDTSVLTAVGNDYGYEHVFSRQVLALGQPGDVLLAISTSGRSPNVLSAMRAGHEKSMVVIGFTGRSGGEMGALAHHILRVPSDSTPLIQQMHIAAAHVVCGLVEERLFPKS